MKGIVAMRFSRLVVVFLLAFIGPILLWIVFWRPNSPLNDIGESEPEVLMQGAEARDFLQVGPSSVLAPKHGEDQVIFLFLHPRNLPRSGVPEDFLIIGGPASGGLRLSLGFEQAQERVVPTLSLESRKGDPGTRYRFSKWSMLPRTWYLIVLALRSDSAIAMYGVEAVGNSGAAVSFLGAQTVPQWSRANISSQRLRVGVVPRSAFRGKIGPVGVLIGAGLSEDVLSFTSELAKSWSSLGDRSWKGHLRLLLKAGPQDLGPAGLPIRSGRDLGKGED